MPPMPEPKYPATRSGGRVPMTPLSSTAWQAAATPYWEKASLRSTSVLSI